MQGVLTQLSGLGSRFSVCLALTLYGGNEFLSRCHQLGAAVLPRVDDGIQNLGERGHAVARLGREVGSAIEGVPLGCEKDRHGPAAAAGHGLHGGHVDLVQVGALLPVDLDVDEMPIQDGSGPIVLKGLVGHDVAPMAGGVTDAEKDRFVLVARFLQRLFAPRIPFHGVAGVLEQIGAGFIDQAVGHVLSLCSSVRFV